MVTKKVRRTLSNPLRAQIVEKLINRGQEHIGNMCWEFYEKVAGLVQPQYGEVESAVIKSETGQVKSESDFPGLHYSYSPCTTLEGIFISPQLKELLGIENWKFPSYLDTQKWGHDNPEIAKLTNHTPYPVYLPLNYVFHDGPDPDFFQEMSVPMATVDVLSRNPHPEVKHAALDMLNDEDFVAGFTTPFEIRPLSSMYYRGTKRPSHVNSDLPENLVWPIEFLNEFSIFGNLVCIRDFNKAPVWFQQLMHHFARFTRESKEFLDTVNKSIFVISQLLVSSRYLDEVTTLHPGITQIVEEIDAEAAERAPATSPQPVSDNPFKDLEEAESIIIGAFWSNKETSNE